MALARNVLPEPSVVTSMATRSQAGVAFTRRSPELMSTHRMMLHMSAAAGKVAASGATSTDTAVARARRMLVRRVFAVCSSRLLTVVATCRSFAVIFCVFLVASWWLLVSRHFGLGPVP